MKGGRANGSSSPHDFWGCQPDKGGVALIACSHPERLVGRAFINAVHGRLKQSALGLEVCLNLLLPNGGSKVA